MRKSQQSTSGGLDSSYGSKTSEVKTKDSRILTSRKFLLCLGVLVASFVLLMMDKDVRALEIIWPATLAVYFGANVSQDFAYRRVQRHEQYDDVPSRDLSDLRRNRTRGGR